MPTIIKVGGSSRAGKTMVSLSIQSKLEQTGKSVQMIHMDEFVVSEEHMPMINGVINWEHPKSIDLPKVLALIKESRSDYLIIEGHLVFAFDNIKSAKNIFVDIDKDLFYHRKKDDQRWGIVEAWYMDHIWNSYLHYGKQFLDEKNTLYINGNQPFDIQQILQFIDQPDNYN